MKQVLWLYYIILTILTSQIIAPGFNPLFSSTVVIKTEEIIHHLSIIKCTYKYVRRLSTLSECFIHCVCVCVTG